MNFYRYLKENLRLMVFYFLLMGFITMVIYLDRENRMLKANLLYVISVSFFMFLVFLIIDYSLKNKQIKRLKDIIKAKDKTPILPAAEDYKDKLYSVIINDLYKQYINSLSQIQEGNKENNEFITSWVHEIKTPITTSKLIIESCDIEVDASLLSSMKEEIDKIDEYVEKVLYYSRSDGFSKDYIISEESIKKLVNESIKKHSLIFIRKQISFINDIDSSFYIDTDKKWLIFIINQLISNSLKYTENKGCIKAIAYEYDNEKVLSIVDSGIGIKQEDIKRIFTKAFTGDNGRNIDTKATGFGLYLSQKLAKKLGHYITVESEYEKGTTVSIHFPKWNDYYVTKM
ncbi:sensor histidine kinase [Clostridium cellulovorans]|uniref:histidine kinase n=1 Tax=Clostridium cellulovorans (strain ATCC 35296 / DSM 3052 / OCM 3 / 743B) TaxID=573061 RepID=D9SMH2_CLOC7|nr:HAMP domain-containing sensor histidine kinase [Clostridium cellulovorans]ADL53828.1 integral membrane sensor signal transduction histidine kinase [Clostridium cellulovorans 743B]